MKFISTLLLLAGLTSLAVARANAELPPASIGVSPNRVELAVNNDATTGSTTVMNFTDKPIRVSTSVVNFDLDENSNFRELAPEAGSLPGAMMINPVDFIFSTNDRLWRWKSRTSPRRPSSCCWIVGN